MSTEGHEVDDAPDDDDDAGWGGGDASFNAAVAAVSGAREGEATEPAPAETPATDAAPAETPAPAAAPEAEKPKEESEEDGPGWERLRQFEARLREEKRRFDEQKRQDREAKSSSHGELTKLLERAKLGDVLAQLDLERRGFFDYTAITRHKLGEKKDPVAPVRGEVEELRARLERFEEERASQAAAREREERLSIVEQAARDRPERFALALDAIETNKHTVMEAIELAMSQRPDLSYGQALTNLETYLRAEHDRRAARLARLTQVGQDVPAPGVTLGQPQDETGSQAAGVRGITNQMSAERGSPRHGEPKSQYDLDREEDDLLAQAARLVGRRA